MAGAGGRRRGRAEAVTLPDAAEDALGPLPPLDLHMLEDSATVVGVPVQRLEPMGH